MSTETTNQDDSTEDVAEDVTFDFPPTPDPSPELRALDRLVGTWAVTGGAEGTVTYEWMEGGYFLIQRVHLEQFGQQIEGFEVVGNLRPFGEMPGPEVHSRFYDNTGNTLDYAYELDGDTLRIWAGEKGSPAHYSGTFDDGDHSLSGSWVYPGGGGYESTMTRSNA